MLTRPVLSLWRYFVFEEVLAVAAVVTLTVFPPPLTKYHFVALLAVAVMLIVRLRKQWHWRFAARVWRFRTVGDGRIVLHYSPEFDGLWDIAELLERCRTEADRVARRFESASRARQAVYLFPTHLEIGRIFGPRYGGTALALSNAIVVAVDNSLTESLRHEFAHLHSLRWSLRAPPLLSEGLSVWLQESYRGDPIDESAWPWLGERDADLGRLLSRRYFFAEPTRDRCYVLAGSFTGFLIRRLGWKTFRKLYRCSSGPGFHRRFKQIVGIGLDTAEKEWRDEVRGMGPMSRPLS